MKKIFTFVFLIFSFFIISCNTNIDSIVYGYNSAFAIDYSDSITSDMLSPGDEGFNPSQMLRDEYFLGSDQSLTLTAPQKSSNPMWKVSDPLTDELIQIRLFGNYYSQYVATEKVFSINGKTCGLEEGKTYKLTLAVTDQGGLLYTDVCAIVVYKRYNFD